MSVQKLLKANETLKHENTTLHQKLDILDELLKENTMKYRNIVSENAILKSECKLNDKSSHEHQQTLSNYTSLQKDIANINMLMSELKNKNKSLIHQNNKYHKQNNLLNIKLNKVSTENHKLQQTNNKHEQDLITTKHELTEAENKINSLNILTDGLKQQLEFGTPVPLDWPSIKRIHSNNIQSSHSNSKDTPITKPIPSHSTSSQNKSNSMSSSAKVAFHTFHTHQTNAHNDGLLLSITNESTAENHWSCPKCTFLNKSNNKICEICGGGGIEQKQNAGPYWNIPTEYFNDDAEDSPLSHTAPQIKTERLCLQKHFKNDKVAYDVWLNSCGYLQNVTLDTKVSYDMLYPLLCQRFIEITHCSRIPTKIDLETIILERYLNDKNDGKNEVKMHMKYSEFLKFWRWFNECCEIVNELSYLWDFKDAYFRDFKDTYLCNLFCGRQQSQQILEKYDNGTFIIRLSTSCKGGVVLSYFEMEHVQKGQSKQRKKAKHSLLIRKGPHKYQQNVNGMAELKTLSDIIKSSEKLRFIYIINNNIRPKNEVFKNIK